jgi:hypothetical protein
MQALTNHGIDALHIVGDQGVKGFELHGGAKFRKGAMLGTAPAIVNN